MPAVISIVYEGPFDLVDVPAAGLFGVAVGVPVEVGASVADLILTSPEWRRVERAEED